MPAATKFTGTIKYFDPGYDVAGAAGSAGAKPHLLTILRNHLR